MHWQKEASLECKLLENVLIGLDLKPFELYLDTDCYSVIRPVTSSEEKKRKPGS